MIATWFYIGCRTRNLFLHTSIFVDLRSGSLLCCSLGSPGYEGTTLLRVGEVLNVEDFKFPVFLDKRYDEESIVGERGSGSGVGRQ